MWNTLRDEFDVLENWLYFDHAAVCPLPRSVRGRMAAFMEDSAHHGHAHYDQLWSEALKAFRRQGARLVHGDPSGVFVVRSTTQGLGIAVTGLPWQAGDNVVVVEGEFPANVRPWVALKRRGVEVRLVPQREGRVRIEDLAEAVDARTRALSVSFVQFRSGFRIDLARVGELCRKHDALFVVDGIQGAGVFPIDVEAAHIDLLSADAHKWLMGPEGVGLGYASSRALERIQPALEGWMSVANPWDFFDLEQPLKPGAARFEEGAYNLVGLHGFLGALDLILDRGVEAFEKRLLALTDVLAERLASGGWRVESPRADDAEKSGILLVTREGLDAKGTVERLKREGIIVSARGEGLRISPHGYNTEADLDALVAGLREAAAHA